MKTIVALATSSGNGAISIIRLSGEKSLEISSKLLRVKDFDKLKNKPRYANLFKLYFENEFIDEGIVIYYNKPYSFTGEDIVEFQIHGGIANAQNLLLLLRQNGATLAQPGEFSKRACLNNKMSLEKAILINELISAKSDFARKTITKNIDGAFKDLILNTQNNILLTLAHIETAIDYADDDIPVNILENAFANLKANSNEMKSIAERSQKKRGIIDGYNLAIVGKPNVGKSSLLNAFLAYDRAIVSDIEGTTRDSIEESLNFHGFLLKLIDTAGIRDSSDLIEELGVKRSYEAIDKSDIILFVVDSSKELSNDEEELLKYIISSKKTFFIVKNKKDLKNINRLEGCYISAINNDIKSLEDELLNHLSSLIDNELILTNTIMIDAFIEASELIDNAILNFNELEFCSYYLNEALNKLSLFGKKIENDDLYDFMFKNFCLGK